MPEDNLFDQIVFQNEEPVYGKNYGRGWIGFNHSGSWMSFTIGVLTRPHRRTQIPISHAFVVTGEDECVEAGFGEGVKWTKLSEGYFHNPDQYVVFRKPRGLTPEIADRICDLAERQIGTKFDYSILANALIQNTFLNLTIEKIPGLSVKDYLARIMDSPDRYLCSELAAYVLADQPEYEGLGVLAHPAGAIDPQRLFEDDVVFEPIKTTIGEPAPSVDEEDVARIRRRLGVPYISVRQGTEAVQGGGGTTDDPASPAGRKGPGRGRKPAGGSSSRKRPPSPGGA